ncbi:hypothetical protein [Paractinoplanes rishiriensis]|uniref:Uncharacterized protein n=1 Tax=Paractinoplanes rishiriensis TaxID=1050105 RepID=A0A919K0B3_9ACTN|nr:hypothetical protein [Actinoplanes rishiriensis]GIE94271.1 hypothetical protein Ari01nite_17360 [Actinoplanes rishiriensis]
MTIPPIDAELALAEVQARRAQVIDNNLTPPWFWPSLGGLILLFVAAVESEVPWLVATGSIVYGVGLAVLIALVVRRVRVQIRPELLGVRGFLTIFGFAAGLVVAGLAVGLTLEALDVPWPATLACLPVAAGLAFGGPRLIRHLRTLMLDGPR